MAVSTWRTPPISSKPVPMCSLPAAPYSARKTRKPPSTHLNIPIERSLLNQLFLKVVLAAILTVLLLEQPAFAQKKTAFITGKVLDENDHPLAGVSVTILGRQSGIMTSDSGNFRIRVEAEKALALVFSFTGYKPEQRNFLLNEKEEERVTIRMEKGSSTLRPVVVTDQQPGREVGLIKVNPKDA